MKRKTALYGLLVALAFIFSYLESLLPLTLGIPGIKLGLANLVVVVTLYCLGARAGLAVALLRILLAGLTFGSLTTMLYSLAGGLLSYGVMLLCRRCRHLSVIGVSMAGGVSHNIGQIIVAAAVTATPQVVWYLPVLILAGLATGALIGFISALLLPKLRKLPL